MELFPHALPVIRTLQPKRAGGLTGVDQAGSLWKDRASQEAVECEGRPSKGGCPVEALDGIVGRRFHGRVLWWVRNYRRLRLGFNGLLDDDQRWASSHASSKLYYIMGIAS